MGEEKFLTVREVSIFLGISEKEVIDLAESGAMPAYKIGGIYLRFKKEQVQEYKKTAGFPQKINPPEGYTLKERISDFLYFNDFFILSFLIIAIMIVVIMHGY